MKVRQLRRSLVLPRPIKEVFSFFADAANLEALTPPWLRFEILSQRPIQMRAGTLIDYRIRLHGIPVRWTSEITQWDPPHFFIDTQRRGPYRLWRHQHRFCGHEDSTQVVDEVEYAIAFDWLTHPWLVKPDLEQIFDFRERELRRLFPAAG
jgi:ligand-binding SRPBCC domain-containing protein